ncbi:hypothetical protein [Pseudomonas sp. N2-11]|uniref:hypothetical protein n=1 Tax=Pseudomonas sp. N2-11 TaxID=2962038 RepID=UPI0020B87A2D|nr:hypothetical protein [Pseudomonas sp. N2-11]MCP3791218.1 hypothetical protein [Pseudomonas sp. N2-11]
MNNPTGRLLDLMTTAQTIHDNAVTSEAWAKIFQCDSSDTVGLFQALAKLLLLVEEARQATQEFIPGDKTIFLEPFAAVENMLRHPHMGSSWSSYKRNLTESVMQGLRFGSHALAFSYPEKSLDESQIKDLLTSLNELLEDCLKADLPQALKTLFAQNLESLRRALVTYRISGPLGLQDELDRISGAILRQQDFIKASAEDPESYSFTNRFFELIGRVNDSVQIVQTGFALAAPLTLFLMQLPKS